MLTLSLLTIAASILPATGATVTGYEETTVASSLSAPTAIAFLPDGRLLVTEQQGKLAVVSGGTATELTTIPVVDCPGTEMGLLGVAVDPSFTSNGYIYLYRTKDGGGGCGSSSGRFNQVVRVTMGPGDTVDLGSLVELLTGIGTVGTNHNGGCLRIGPDGKLFVGVGDSGLGDAGAPGEATNPYAQDLAALEGKVLRLDLDGTIPSDNPFFGQSGKRAEIFASGFRNPWRFGFDPDGGRLWLGDVGQNTIEEVDIVVPGGDYSWPHCEGNLPLACRQSGEIAPVLTYPHSGDDALGSTVIGGAFAGPLFGPADGNYFFADWSVSVIYTCGVNAMRTGVTGVPAPFVTLADGPVDIVFGPDGALYYVAINAGEVRRVALVSGGDQLVSGRTLALKDGVRKALRVRSMNVVVPGIGADDPTVAGASLRVAGSGFDDTYPLPASGWKTISGNGVAKGYRYSDPKLLNGPIARVVLRSQRVLKAVGHGAGLGHVVGASDPGPVDLVLTTGERRFCMSFGGTPTLVPGKSFIARNAPAPAACHP